MATVGEVISFIDEVTPNIFTKSQKLYWLSSLDELISEEIIKTHEGGEDHTFTPYGENTPDDTELLAPAPYDAVYRYHLLAQIDLYNGEITRYNNSAALYNEAYIAFLNWYNRTHMPLKGAELSF